MSLTRQRIHRSRIQVTLCERVVNILASDNLILDQVQANLMLEHRSLRATQLNRLSDCRTNEIRKWLHSKRLHQLTRSLIVRWLTFGFLFPFAILDLLVYRLQIVIDLPQFHVFWSESGLDQQVACIQLHIKSSQFPLDSLLLSSICVLPFVLFASRSIVLNIFAYWTKINLICPLDSLICALNVKTTANFSRARQTN